MPQDTANQNEQTESQKELKADNELSQTLFKISNAVNTTENLEELFRLLHQILKEIIDVTNFAIGLYDRDKDILSYPYYVDETGDVYQEIYNVSESVIMAKEVLIQKSAVFLSKEESIERAKNLGAEVAGSIPEQWLGVPLRIKGEAIGVIVVQSYKDPKRFQKKDADILMSISDQIAIAIDRKRAQENLLRSEKLNRTLFSIANAVITTENLDDLYRSIFESLNMLIPLPNFIITLYNKKDNSLFFPLHIDEYDSEENIEFFVSNINECNYICIDVIKSKKPIFLTQQMLNERDEKMGTPGTMPAVWLGVPLIIQDEVIGTITVQHYSDPDYFTQKDMDLFIAASGQVALAIERKRSQARLLEVQKELIAQAHKAGMADLASNTIHNIGNILNSLNTSAFLIKSSLRNSNSHQLFKANSLLKENLTNIESFILEDPKGRTLLEYYLAIGDSLQEETIELTQTIDRVIEKIEMITHIIQSQLKYTIDSDCLEICSLETLVEDALNIQSLYLDENKIRVIKRFKELKPLPVHKARLINILAEIIQNAVEAMDGNYLQDRALTIHIESIEDKSAIKISDMGHGISEKEMKNIFSQNFAMRSKKSSVSLHNCANYMAEMDGSIKAYSKGRDQGATFTLIFNAKTP